jgi:hypothetical protein
MIALCTAIAMSHSYSLSLLDLRASDQGWGVAQANLSVTGKPMRIGNQSFTQGWGTHAPSELIVNLRGEATRFRAVIGVDGAADGPGSVRFSVVGDGRLLYRSKTKTKNDAPEPLNLDLKGIKTLILRTDSAGDGMASDHANWADAYIDSYGSQPEALEVHPEFRGRINPGKRWRDEDGNIIQAHSGGILKHGNRIYWFGENRTHGYHNKTGVSAYSSTDLINWKSDGIVMTKSAFPTMFQDEGVCERPKVIHNKRTGKFLMWSHLDANGYRNSKAGVAVADKITGPFRHVKDYQPFPGKTFRDMNLFVDDDGSAYVLYSSEDNATMHILRLTDDYLSHVEPAVEGKTWARAFVGQYREAPAPFKHKGRYYVITSGCTGWSPNPAQVAVADHPFGPWKVLGNPAIGRGAQTTFLSQSTFVFSPPWADPGQFIFMADRWSENDLGDSRYVWLPFTITNPEKVEIRWEDSWNPVAKASWR